MSDICTSFYSPQGLGEDASPLIPFIPVNIFLDDVDGSNQSLMDLSQFGYVDCLI